MAGKDAYSFKPGGSLKFKGGESPVLAGKKKKKTKSSTSKDVARRSEYAEDAPGSSSKGKEREEPDQVDDAALAQRSSGPAKTAAERKFEEVRLKRMAERVAREAKMSHKEKVDKFNRDLENQTEHYDLPKVGPG
ncbi:DUF1754-domain-containing protein [Acaromyces ingoldii]|uniref:DUF1754-domain-containing protein n=1 Tax=Acaromyces ingoldii TaxID=215250 RepID=A0A316YI13_9BASI|nr:DUF1754-domain-containing protein [Acaromyces ingoldii]PWN88474.1 DUF1754-domain-containing protein [Acaromyces ingoldii]